MPAKYGAEHKALRRRWQRQVAHGTVPCWRCGDLIEAGSPWDLGHDDDDSTQYRGPEHRGCNRSTLSHWKERAVRTDSSREW